VVLHDVGKRRLIPNGRDPARQLRVPDGGVSTDEFVVLGSPVDEEVGCVQRELVLRALGGIPLHRVLGRDLAKVVDDDLGVGALLEEALVGGNTNVLLALLLELVVQEAVVAVGAGLAGGCGDACGSGLGGDCDGAGLGGRGRDHNCRSGDLCRKGGRGRRGCGGRSLLWDLWNLWLDWGRVAACSLEALAVPVIHELAVPAVSTAGVSVPVHSSALAPWPSSREDSSAGGEEGSGEVDVVHFEDGLSVLVGRSEDDWRSTLL
jgi:hypothetical protein